MEPVKALIKSALAVARQPSAGESVNTVLPEAGEGGRLSTLKGAFRPKDPGDGHVQRELGFRAKGIRIIAIRSSSLQILAKVLQKGVDRKEGITVQLANPLDQSSRGGVNRIVGKTTVFGIEPDGDLRVHTGEADPK